MFLNNVFRERNISVFSSVICYLELFAKQITANNYCSAHLQILTIPDIVEIAAPQQCKEFDQKSCWISQLKCSE